MILRTNHLNVCYNTTTISVIHQMNNRKVRNILMLLDSFESQKLINKGVVRGFYMKENNEMRFYKMYVKVNLNCMVS